MRHLLGLALASVIMAGGAMAQTPCGGAWRTFLSGVEAEARASGISQKAISAVLSSARQSSKVLRRDRAQGVFKQSFIEFSSRAVSANRIQRAGQMQAKYARTFDVAQSQFGIPPQVILAFWAMETDFGAFMGDVHTVSALATLAHDCRRPHLFRPQLIAAMALLERGDFSANTQGAWAGEIGHVQMLPGDILNRGVDGDGDGHVRLSTSAPDAILTAASMLKAHGWRKGEPWLVEVTAPKNLDWSLSGFPGARKVSDWVALGVKPRAGRLNGSLRAALILPMGKDGPKFLAYHNFSEVFLEWNKSLVNTLTAGYLATRIGGADRYLKGNSSAKLSDAQMKTLQTRLASRGHDVGKIDGILGAGTRAAVRAEQARLGMAADGWPTDALVRALR